MFLSILALILFLFFYFKDDKAKQENIKKITVKRKKEVSSKKNNSPLILNIGVCLILFSSIIFIITSWNLVPDVVKVIMLEVEMIISFGLGMTFKYTFKNNSTGNLLINIGCLLIGLILISMGYFKVFGLEFSLVGTYKYLFLGIVFIFETIIFIVRKLINKSENNFLILLFSFVSFFFIILHISKDFIFSFSEMSVVLFLFSIFNKAIFNNSKKDYKIFNIIISVILTLVYIYSCTYFFLNGSEILLRRLPVIVSLCFLSLNAFVNANKNKNYLIVISILYESFLTLWFVSFTRSIMISSYAFIVSAISLYFIYYISKNKTVKLVSLIDSYIQILISIILILFDRTSVLVAPIISFMFIILTMISLIKDKGKIKKCNIILQPIFLILFTISILQQNFIFNKINLIDIIMLINVVLLVSMIISSIIKSKLKYSYFVFMLIGLLVQIIGSYYSNIIYPLIAISLNVVLIIYCYFVKDKFYNKSLNFLIILFVINALIGFHAYLIIQLILLLTVLIFFSILNKNNNNKYLYLSLIYIPAVIFINKILPVRYSVGLDISYLLLIFFFMIFSRGFIKEKNKETSSILEMILFSLAYLLIRNNLFSLILLAIIYFISYILSLKHKNSSKIYLNYLMFLTPLIFLKVESGMYEGLYMICIFCLMIINQIFYRILFEKRNTALEVIHLIFTMFLLMALVNTVGFGYYLSAFLSFVILIILYLIYEKDLLKNLVIMFLTYPLITLFKAINNLYITNILNMFVWVIPLVILTRKVFKLKEDSSTPVESIVISIMYLMFIFKFNIYVGITLCAISIIFILIGKLLKYKSLYYVGFISLLITLIIQVFGLFNKISLWLVLLIIGIILVIISILKSKKK